MQHLCPRCRHAIPTEDDGALHFCHVCGAPQVRLSEELLLAAEAASNPGQNPDGTTSTNPDATTAAQDLDRDHINWRGAIHCALLAGLIALALELLSLASGIFDLLAFFWATGAPIIILGIYAARFRETRINTDFGARLGLLTGGFIALAMASVDLVHTLLDRFVYHSAAALDAQTAASFAQIKSQTLARAGSQSAAVAAQLVGMLNLPEFRAGIFLSGIAFVTVAYLIFSTTGGAFAGFLRSRKPAA
jgi:hypothetical protein